MKAFSLFLMMAALLVNVSVLAQAEPVSSDALKSDYSYVDLSTAGKPEAEALLMMQHDKEQEAKNTEASDKPATAQCFAANKQFVHCMR